MDFGWTECSYNGEFFGTVAYGHGVMSTEITPHVIKEGTFFRNGKHGLGK